jgi:hypothetical protein
MDSCPSWADPTGCWQAERGYLSPATHSMMDGARALPTGSLNKVILSYPVILTTILTSLPVEWLRAVRQILLPLRDRDMKFMPCDC